MKSVDRDAQILEFRGFLSFLILHELKQKPQSGDELAVRIGKRKGSTLTPGTIYPTLKRLHKLKLIIYRRDGRKKVYTLTDVGVVELNKQYAMFSKYFLGFKAIIRRQPKEKPKRVAKAVEKPVKQAEKQAKAAESGAPEAPKQQKTYVEVQELPSSDVKKTAQKKEKPQLKRPAADQPAPDSYVQKDSLEDISKQ